MRFPRFLVGVSIVNLAAALTPFAEECGYPRNVQFNGTNADIFVRCAETTYKCNRTLHGAEWFSINSTNEAIPIDCEKDMSTLQTTTNFSGPLVMPGLTEIRGINIHGGYDGYMTIGEYVLLPTKMTSIDLPDLVNISRRSFFIDNTDSISRLTVPKLRHIASSMELNFTGGPAINLSFPSLLNVGSGIYLHGEIDALDLPSLNNTGYLVRRSFDDPANKTEYSIRINSTGNLNCNAFAASVVNSTSSYSYGVLCTSKKGTVTLQQVKPPESEGNGSVFKTHGNYLALTALVTYILAL